MNGNAVPEGMNNLSSNVNSNSRVNNGNNMFAPRNQIESECKKN